MAFFQAAIIGLIALALTPGWLFYFDVTPKVVVLLLGTAAVLFCGGRAPRWFSILLTLSLLSLGISSALSANPALSLFGTNWRRFGAVTQASTLLFAWSIARHTSGRLDRARTILRGVSLAAALTAIYGIAQYFKWDPILPAAAYHIGEGIWTIVRPPGTLGYVSYFATWLVITAFLSLALMSVETSAIWRRLAALAAALTVLAMLLTGTRAGVLGLVVGGVVWLCCSGLRSARRTAGIGLILLLAGVAFYFSPLGWQLRSRTRWFGEDPWGGARIALWRDSVQMAAKRLPFGYGPEVFTATFPHFESKELARAYPDFAHESPHNIFLDALVAQGVPGLLLLSAFCFAGFRGAMRSGCPWLAAALAAGIVSQLFTVFTVPTAVILYTTIALCITVRLDYKTRPAAGNPVGARRFPPGGAGSFICTSLAAMALIYCGVRLTLADHALALAKRSVDSENVRSAAEHYQRYRRWRFPGTSADLWYSRALMNLAQKTRDPGLRLQAFVQAGAAASQATQTSEDPFNAWYNQAGFAASRNDAAGAEQSLRAAIDAHPKWFKPHWTLAQVLRLQSRLEEAEREAALAVDLDGGKYPEVTRTLEEIRAARLFQK